MGKIKLLLDKQKLRFVDVCIRYTATIVVSAIMCLLYVIVDATDYRGELWDHILVIGVVFIVCAFLTEIIRDHVKEEDKRKRISEIGYGVSFAASLICDLLNRLNSRVSDKTYERIVGWMITFVIAVILISIYRLIINSEMSMQEYALIAILNLACVTAYVFILNIGFFLLILLFDLLIKSLSIWTWYGYMQILLTGFVYVPYIVMSLTDKESNLDKLKGSFTRYGLMPLVLGAVIIIYMYMIKLLLGLDKLSNVIFNPCEWLFIIGAPIWEIAGMFSRKREKQTKFDKIIYAMPYIYAPFILLEIYSMTTRIAQYGITETRYAAIEFIVFQIIYVLWKPICKTPDGKEKLLFVLLGLIVIGLAIPGINAEYVAYKSQRNRFEETFEKLDGVDTADYDEEDIKKLKGALYYLRWNTYGEEYLKSRYTDGELDALIDSYGYAEDDIIHREEKYYDMKSDRDGRIDVPEGYTSMYSFRAYESDEKVKDYYIEFEITYGTDKNVEIDISKQLSEIDNLKDEPITIMAGDKCVIITNLSATQIENGEAFSHVSVDGYVFEK